MPGFIAKKLCPNLVIVPPNFDKYRAVSGEVRSKPIDANTCHTTFCISVRGAHKMRLSDPGDFRRLRSTLPADEPG